MHQRTGGRNRLNFNTALYLLRVVCTVLRVDLEIVALQMKCEEINQHYKKKSEHFEFSFFLFSTLSTKQRAMATGSLAHMSKDCNNALEREHKTLAF